MIRRRRRSSHDSRIKGHSYAQAWYEDAIGAILARSDASTTPRSPKSSGFMARIGLGQTN
jgi:hypothetical protein